MTPTPTPVAIATVLPNQTTVVDASRETRAAVRLVIPPQTFGETRLIMVSDAAAADVPGPLPPGVGAVRKPFEVTAFTEDGSPEEHPTLARCITLTVLPDPEDIAAARGDLLSLVLMRYDSRAAAWTVLTTQADMAAGVLSAQVCQSLSLFGIGVLDAPPTPAPPPEVTPTATVLPVLNEGRKGPPLALAVLVAGAALVLASALFWWSRRR